MIASILVCLSLFMWLNACNISRNNQSYFVRCPALRLLCNNLCGPRKKGWRALWRAYVCYSQAINQWTGQQCPIVAQIVWYEHSMGLAYYYQTNRLSARNWFTKPSLKKILAAWLKMRKICLVKLGNKNQVTMKTNPTVNWVVLKCSHWKRK